MYLAFESSMILVRWECLSTWQGQGEQGQDGSESEVSKGLHTSCIVRATGDVF